MANRQGAAWTLEARPWAEARAVRNVERQLTRWGLPMPAGLEAVVRLLVSTTAADGGRHISLHLAEENRRILALALSHRADPPPLSEGVLTRLQGLGALSCGTESTVEGRQVWAVVPATV
ncbi:hypothetical protein [Streptomyces jumonjinensis]|uniref:ATP-binding protein n=1 Tax=Streptomyces jumonjinensis TaxID=1945 RepID=A0A646KB98_STRJU|nr:hypothetical protein [Streptomyces jumonjinensis]MQS99494.1 hypothetical protein [Streptomyces jumonjinensis]